jgi:hypothetical protein
MLYIYNLQLLKYGFQSPATSLMEAIVDMHHYVFFYLILIFIFVMYMYIYILVNFLFIPSYLYELSYKFNDYSFIGLKLIKTGISLILNFDFLLNIVTKKWINFFKYFYKNSEFQKEYILI